ncbi:MAG: histidine kinase [Clostridia bacterium]|nr:histidine kinase [Clostridia bacterium]
MNLYHRIPNFLWRPFRNRPLFRRLDKRMHTMILALVMPVCLACIAISVASAIQTASLVRESSANALALHMQTVAVRQETQGIDPLENFPEAVTELTGLSRTVEGFGGSFYTSMDGHRAWKILPDKKGEPVDTDFEKLAGARSHFLWQAEDGSYQILVTFPYNFILRVMPAWHWFGLALSVLTILSCPFLFKRLKLDVLDPMDTLNGAISGIKTDLSYRIPEGKGRESDEYLHLFAEFNAMAEEVQASHEKSIRILETEMDNLRLQVNPHMLLNSYNMIYALAESKNYAVIQDYTLCLVDYFRYVLRQGQNVVTVRQELNFVDNFIRIQRIRFPNRFSYVYQAPEDCMDARIPPLLIENFVENAVKYALDPVKAIEIIVSVHREQDDNGKEKLHIAITDTGSGIRPEVLEKLKAHEPYIDEAGHRHIGISNCFRRVELFYGEEGTIHFSSGVDQGTQIYLVVPFTTDDPAEEASA